jgi:hypothetical protein
MEQRTTPDSIAEELINPKVRAQKKVTDFGYPGPEHVDSENIKLKIGSRSLLYQLFSKRDFIHKMWLKLAKIDRFLIFFSYFHIFQVVEHIPDSFRMNTDKNETLKNINLWSIFINFSHII